MRRILVAACALLVAGCTAQADLKQALEVTDVSTGWFDAGVVDGKNKLVPSVTFRLRNTSNADIDTASINVVYKYADNGDEHDNIFVQRIDFTDKATAPVTVRSPSGYTGDPPQTRADMLKHSMFRDITATIYVRQSSSQWVQLHHVQVARELLTH